MNRLVLMISLIFGSTISFAENPGKSTIPFAEFESSTPLEWAQNLGQLCAQKSCQRSQRGRVTQHALKTEIEKRFRQETGDSLSEMSLERWSSLIQETSDANRCRLLRTAFVLSFLEQAESPSPRNWRLFTEEKVFQALTLKGHLTENGASPLCPDYYYPQSDVAELALERGRRFLSAIPPTPEEAESRIRELEKRYLSRGKVFRAPTS